MVCDTSYEGGRTLVHPVLGVIGGHVHPLPVLGAVPGDKGEGGHVWVQQEHVPIVHYQTKTWTPGIWGYGSYPCLGSLPFLV